MSSGLIHTWGRSLQATTRWPERRKRLRVYSLKVSRRPLLWSGHSTNYAASFLKESHMSTKSKVPSWLSYFQIWLKGLNNFKRFLIAKRKRRLFRHEKSYLFFIQIGLDRWRLCLYLLIICSIHNSWAYLYSCLVWVPPGRPTQPWTSSCRPPCSTPSGSGASGN